MKYVVQSILIFDTADYILTSLTDSNTSVKLSNSAGRVLEELIKQKNIDSNTPVTRDHLFSIVWRAYGLEPSNGNLNQQISLIRKTLTSFGLDPSSIITMPKRGLKLNSQLTIEKINEETPCPSSTIHKTTTIDKNNNLPSSALLNIKAHMKYMTTLATIVTILFSIGFFYLYTKKDHIKLYCCKEINSCNICTFHSESGLDCSGCTMQCTEMT